MGDNFDRSQFGYFGRGAAQIMGAIERLMKV
jgi:hypothetical protein